MKVTMETGELHDILKLSKADAVSVISEFGNTFIVASTPDIIIVKEINNVLLEREGVTKISKDAIKLLPARAEVTITENEMETKNRKLLYQPNEQVDEDMEIEDTLIIISGRKLKEMLTCDYAISKDETRPVLCGISIYEDEFAALDGYRVSIRQGKFDAKEQVIIHKTLVDVLKKIKFDDKDQIAVNYDAEHVSFMTGNLEVIGRRIKGDYINYKCILPKDFKTEAELDIKEIVTLLKDYKSAGIKYVRMTFENDRIQLRASNKQVIVQDTINAYVEGDVIEITFNLDYLIEGLKGYDKATLKLNGRFDPMVITDNDSRYELILPIRMAKED